MEPENTQSEIKNASNLNKVTTFSKYLALVLFVSLPFIGGWIGYTLAPEKIAEVEKVIVKVAESEPISSQEIIDDATVMDVNDCDVYFTETSKNMSDREKLECEKLWSAPDINGYSRFSYHPQQITLNGRYVKYFFSDNDKYRLTSKSIHFIPDISELSKLPVSDYAPANGQINFRNVKDVEAQFAVPAQLDETYKADFCTLSGRASVIVSEIIIDNFEGGIPTSLRMESNLDELITKESFEISCE